jgi:hypothetical protein
MQLLDSKVYRPLDPYEVYLTATTHCEFPRFGLNGRTGRVMAFKVVEGGTVSRNQLSFRCIVCTSLFGKRIIRQTLFFSVCECDLRHFQTNLT